MPHDTLSSVTVTTAASAARSLCGRLRAQLLALIAVLVLVPLALYAADRWAEARRAAQTARLTAISAEVIDKKLLPVLQTAVPGDVERINGALAPLRREGQSIRIFFAPDDAVNLFYIASTPAVSPAQLAGERASLQADGTLARLDRACDSAVPHTAVISTATAAVAVGAARGPGGCWAVAMTLQDDAGILDDARRVLDATPEWRVPALAYGFMLLLALLLSAFMWATTRRLAGLTTALEREALPADALENPHLIAAGRVRAIAPPSPAMTSEPPAADLAPVNLSSIVHAFANAQWMRLGDAGDRLAVEVTDGVVVEGREELIAALLGNLVENAFEAGGEGRVFVEVMTAREDGRRIAILSVACKGVVAETGANAESASAARARFSAAEQCAQELSASLTTTPLDPVGSVVLVKFPPARFCS
jgi:hypothetical protein